MNFLVLSDSDKKVSQLYGVDTYFFPKRVTFLIDENGIVLDIVKNISLDNYGKSIIQKFGINSGSESNVQK